MLANGEYNEHIISKIWTAVKRATKIDLRIIKSNIKQHIRKCGKLISETNSCRAKECDWIIKQQGWAAATIKWFVERADTFIADANWSASVHDVVISG